MVMNATCVISSFQRGCPLLCDTRYQAHFCVEIATHIVDAEAPRLRQSFLK